MMDGDTLSSILGWISIACWIIVYSPQIYENYTLQSGDGLSVFLLLAWVLGDLCNLVGAVLGQLAPTMILLAIYYIISDLTLLGQLHYYRWKRRRYARPVHATSLDCRAHDGEEEPLLGVLPARAKTAGPESLTTLVVRYTLCLLFISAFGVAAWWIDERKDRAAKGEFPQDGIVSNMLGTEGSGTLRACVVQVLGWTSAVVYVSAAIPQIFKNLETRCEGLSPALFLFATIGNFSYAISICAKSVDRHYLIMSASWLVGNVLIGLSDCIIIGQVVYYGFAERGWANAVGI